MFDRSSILSYFYTSFDFKQFILIKSMVVGYNKLIRFNTITIEIIRVWIIVNRLGFIAII